MAIGSYFGQDVVVGEANQGIVDRLLGELDFQMDEGEGKPSRWNTLRAMRVLRACYNKLDYNSPKLSSVLGKDIGDLDE